MFYTYVLKSLEFIKYYVGYTHDLNKRLADHNKGKSIYTNRFKPWQVVYFEEFADKSQAVQRGKYFKSAAGRKWLKKNLNK